MGPGKLYIRTQPCWGYRVSFRGFDALKYPPDPTTPAQAQFSVKCTDYHVRFSITRREALRLAKALTRWANEAKDLPEDEL